MFENILKPLAKHTSDKEAVGLVSKRYEDYKDHGYLKQWFLNMAFFCGEQWVEWDETNQRIFKPNAPSYRVRMVDNQLQPLVRKEVAKLTKSNFMWQVFAATGEESDINSAKMCNKLLDALWRQLEMDNKRIEASLWAALTGTSFIKTWYDVDKGPYIFNGEYNQPIGDINAIVVSPFELITNSNFEDISRAWWVMHVAKQDVERVREVWGKKVAPDTKEESRNMYESKILNMAMNRADNEEKAETCTIKEYWERPTKEHPNGRLIITAGDTLLYNGDNPTPGGDLPFADFRHITVPGRFWGTTAIETGIPHQKMLNAILSQILEIMKKTARPAMLVPIGSGVKDVTNAAGSIIHYNPIMNMKPEWQHAPSIPAYMLQMLDRHLAALYNQFGQHEVSHGTVPSGVRSGVGIRFLQEEDDTMLGPTAHSYASGYSRLGKLWLAIAAQDYDEQRQVRYVGKNHQVEVIDFEKSNITGSEDVEVVPGTILPESRAARQDFLKELYQLGAFVDPMTGKPDNAKFLKLLEIGSYEEIYDEIATDMNSAEMESRYMAKGQYETIHRWDNHGTHLWKHNSFRKSIDYNSYPPEIKELFERHIRLHEAANTGPDGVVWAIDGTCDEQAFAAREEQKAKMQQMMSQLQAQMPQPPIDPSQTPQQGSSLLPTQP